MNDVTGTAGHAVVGRLTDIAPWEAELVLSLRLWTDGTEGQAEVWNGFARSLGGPEGRDALNRFEALLSHIGTHARRPLVRRGVDCLCIGADEAVLQTLVREAARGDLAEARMIAGLLVQARHADAVARMAAEVGHTMKLLARDARVRREAPEPRVLH